MHIFNYLPLSYFSLFTNTREIYFVNPFKLYFLCREKYNREHNIRFYNFINIKPHLNQQLDVRIITYEIGCFLQPI